MKLVLFLGMWMLSLWAFAHEGHHPPLHTTAIKNKEASKGLQSIYKDINKKFDASVKSIFEKKCAACHSVSTPSPWYSSIPIVHSIVESDRSEAKEHLEISRGFPFAGHGTPAEDLVAVGEVIAKDTMPPALYLFLHPSSKLTAEEKTKILEWVTSAENGLREVSKSKTEKTISKTR